MTAEVPEDVLADWRRQRLAAFDAQVPRRFTEPVELADDVTAWLQRLLAGDGQNLLLIGPVGTGKTHTAVTVARAAAEHLPRHVLFLTGSSLNDAVRPRAGHDATAAIDRLRQADLLVLDDLGVASLTGWVHDALFAVLDHRYGWLRPTIMTSNVADVRELLGPQIASRVAQEAVVVTMAGPDRRRGGHR